MAQMVDSDAYPLMVRRGRAYRTDTLKIDELAPFPWTQRRSDAALAAFKT